jgi:predicted lactoylglutathione lyase
MESTRRRIAELGLHCSVDETLHKDVMIAMAARSIVSTDASLKLASAAGGRSRLSTCQARHGGCAPRLQD